MDKRLAKTSKFLSLVLRHDPSAAGVELDSGGWVSVEALLDGLSSAGMQLTRAELEEVVSSNDKQRFVIRDGRIRASQGHSLPVDLGLVPETPPETLFHGTGSDSLEEIRAQGLRPMSRQHVHLSEDLATALKVGRRHGRVRVLKVDAARLHARGCPFFRSENGVWLVAGVPPDVLDLLPPDP